MYFFYFRLKDSKNKEDKSMSLIGILLGILIMVIGKNWLDTKKDYITKIETIIKTNTPAEKTKRRIYKRIRKKRYKNEIIILINARGVWVLPLK